MIKVLLFAAAIFLLFFRLDSPMLWQDEGEVALIARNINKYGLPVVWDGQTLISQEEGQDSKILPNGMRVWSWNTWLPYYAAAISFKTFGENTAAARLPFALAGIGILIISYLLAKKITSNPLVCLAVLATNTLFYLYSRQTRYYAFSMLFPLAAVYFYFAKKYWLYFFALLASFHSNFVLAFGFNLPLILISLKRKETWLFLLQSVFWIWYFQPASLGGDFGFYRYWQGLPAVFTKLFSYLNIINSFYFPLVFSVPLLFFRKFNLITKVLICGVFAHLIVIGYFLQFGQRNLVTLIPVFSILLGLLLVWVWHKNRFMFLVVFALFVFTNFFYIFSERLLHPTYWNAPLAAKSFFLEYVTTLPEKYPGPLEGTREYLITENISASDLIYTDYEINSLRFYFPHLRFVDHPSADVTIWLPRRNWGNLRELSDCQKKLVENGSQKVVLPFYDTQWENMPDITYHHFKIADDMPKLTIYKVESALNWKQCG